MQSREEDFNSWELFWERIDAFAVGISRYKAKNVNAAELRQQARELVKSYRLEVRTALRGLGVTDSSRLDAEMQSLMGLSSGKNAKSSYQKALRNLKSQRKQLETGLEFLIGTESVAAGPKIGNVESAVLKTLETMLPLSAASYRQALQDICDEDRLSYRGTAAELREVVREVLDHLAPDESVVKSTGFKLEAGQKGPTMKQKVRFILRARKVGDSQRQTAENAVEHVDEKVASLGRAVYTRGSTDVHTPRPKEEVLNFKLYADAILGECSQFFQRIHRSPQTATVEACWGDFTGSHSAAHKPPRCST